MSKNKKAGTTPGKKPPVERIIPIELESSEEDAEVSSSVSPEKPPPDENKPSVPDAGTETAKSADPPVRTLPPYNVPEKIVIVLDRACDEVFSYFELNNGTKYRPLQMLKNALLFFVYNKNLIDAKHQFALVVLNESSASWALDFTGDAAAVVDAINKVDECATEDIFDLNGVFELIGEKVRPPTVVGDALVVPPPYVVRTVFLYGRSITMPQFEYGDAVKELLDSPYFTFDVVMTHEVPDSSNRCQQIFKKLQELDTKGYAYFYPVGRNSSELHLVMGKLTGHPLQRPVQK